MEQALVRKNLTLWFGMIFPPFLWLTQMEVSYLLVSVSCKTGKLWPLHLTTGISMLLAGMAGVIMWRMWSQLRYREPVTQDNLRMRFMSLLGLMSVALFGLAILAQGIPKFILNPCHY